MKTLFTLRRRSAAAVAFSLILGAATLGFAVLPGKSAISRGPVHTIEPPDVAIAAPDSFVAGDAVPVEIQSSDPNAQYTIYSNPPGVVSGGGTLDGTDNVVCASSDPDAAPGDVTIYVATDDNAVASTDSTATN